eukprot:FR739055.1.p1 GENE.FR739055.1~~FR739055.1.p1  ORF type:complete len:113 (+),score=18.80 FR739055.1:835-1173(+)
MARSQGEPIDSKRAAPGGGPSGFLPPFQKRRFPPFVKIQAPTRVPCPAFFFLLQIFTSRVWGPKTLEKRSFPGVAKVKCTLNTPLKSTFCTPQSPHIFKNPGEVSAVGARTC